jgi:hypothetical protein
MRKGTWLVLGSALLAGALLSQMPATRAADPAAEAEHSARLKKLIPKDHRCDESWDLGKATQYHAFTHGGVLLLIADGEKPGSAYQVCLGQSPNRIKPPQYELRWKSAGIGTGQQTEFRATALFDAAGVEETVTINDEAGAHKVKVEPLPEAQIRAAGATQYVVYASLVAEECVIVPEGTIMPMIYAQVYGPASRKECQQFTAEHCGVKE